MADETTPLAQFGDRLPQVRGIGGRTQQIGGLLPGIEVLL